MQPVKQLTKEQAIKAAQSEIWKDMTDQQIVQFQLFQSRLCMPFGEFHRAISAVLNRAVYTHEFGDSDALKAEFLGEKKTANTGRNHQHDPGRKADFDRRF